MDEIIEGFRLSPQQARLWALHQAGGDYASRLTALLEGPLDPEALRGALERVVERHEILRTTFRRVAGMAVPLQVVGEGGVSWQDDGAIDLERGPVLHARLTTLAPRGHLLTLSLPALCADPVSLGNLLREAVLEHAGEDPGTSEAMQYIDFSEWQYELLESGEGAEHWQRQGGGLDGWRLPFESALSVRREPYQPAEIDIPWNAPEGASAGFCLAVWQALLARLSGLSRIGIGVSLNGRNYEGLGAALGLFARYLPVAAEVDGQPVEAHSRRAGEAMLDANLRQESFAWERLEGAPAGDGLRAGFRFDELPADFEAGELRVSVREIRARHERCDLELAAVRSADGAVALRLVYDPSLFPAAEMERLADQFRALAEAALAAPEAPIAELELLSGDERRQLLVDFNATDSPREERFLHQRFAAQAARAPESVAVRSGGRTLTFAELDAAANRFAHHLQRLGAGPDMLTAIALDRSPELLIALLGVLKAGGAYLPLDAGQPRERLVAMLEDSAAAVLVTGPRFPVELPGLAGAVVDIERDREAIASEPIEDPAVPVSPENLAYVLYTSGSTGRPKGVAVPHAGLANYLAWAARTYPAAAGAPVHSPIGFDLTVTSLFVPLLCGGAAALLPEEQGLGMLAEALGEGGFGLVKITPAHLDVLGHLLPPAAAAGAARALVVGGEALTTDRLAFWRAHAPETRVYNEYGPTETVVGCCVHQLLAGDASEGDRPVPIGRPIANTRLYVLDLALRPVPMWVPGELFIGGQSVARGYLRQPALTAERFVPDAWSGRPGERLYRTGDLVRHLPDGVLEYLGRADDQVKVRGHRVEPGEIEAALIRHPAVRECAVVMRDEEGAAGRRLVAYFVADAEEASPSELRRFLETKLPSYMVPASFLRVPALPLTANGKVDRRALARTGPLPGPSRPDLEEAYVPPNGPDEELLADVWARVLGVDRVGAEDNFFALGGDSIRSIQVRSEAEKRGFPLTTQQIFQHPTIRALARELRGPAEVVEPVAPFGLLSDADRARLPQDVEDAYPITQLQAGMIFHSELSPESAIYHDIFSFEVRGPLDPTALRAALQQLAARHPVLRTGFELAGYDEPLQLVYRAAEVPLQFEDVSALETAEQDAAVAAWIRHEKRLPFDWQKPPLLRAHVHRRGDASFQFGLGFHHAILDGWSLASLLSELFRQYLFLVGGEAVPAEAPPELSYREFVAAEQRVLESAEARAYWAGVLGLGAGGIGGGGARTFLPRWRPTRTAQDGARDLRPRFVALPAEISEGVKRVAQRAGVPLKSVLLAAHLRALSVLCGETDVMTGLVTNGRLEEEGGERVLGLFLNTLPLRLQASGGSWLELVRAAFEAERTQLPYRRFPLAELQRMAGGPFFETVFNFVHFHVYQSVSGLRGLEVVGGGGFEEANFPFAANFAIDLPTAPIELRFDYDAAELGRDQMDAIAAVYRHTLEALAADPEARYDHTALPPENLQQLFAAGEGAPVPPLAPATVHERFAAQAERTPGAVAIAFEPASDADAAVEVTYAELAHRASRLAHHLAGLGVGPETRVGVCLPRSPDLLVALLGTLQAGGAYVPLDPEYPAERLTWLLADAGAKVLVTDRRGEAELSEAGRPTVVLEPGWDGEESSGGLPVSDPGQTAYVVYTSGSTGTPKGVAVSQGSLVNFSQAVEEAIGLGPGRRMLQFASIAFDASALQIFPTLLSGAALVLHPDPAALTSEEILALCERRGVTVLDLPGALWRQWVETMAAAGEPLPAAISVYMTGGEKLSRETLRLWSPLVEEEALFFSSYGPTEATITTTFFSLTANDVWTLPPVEAPLGRPLPGTRVRLLDPHLEPVPPGAPGELYIGGAGLARGYLHQPSLTAERFLPDPFCGGHGEAGGRLYRTGDLARFRPGDSRGGLEFLGRADHQVKIRGFRIEPGEIETVLARHAAVREAVVLAREDGGGAPRLAAYLLVEAGETPSGAPGITELRAHVAASLPDFMVPSDFVLLEQWPLLPSGKVDRRALPAPDAARLAPGVEHVPPRDAVERVLADIWSQVLGVEKVGVFDDFFEQGGHSLLATQAITRIRQAFETDLQLRHIFDSPTIAALANVLLRDPETRSRIERTAEIRVRLAEMSDEEVEALLMAEATAAGDASEGDPR